MEPRTNDQPPAEVVSEFTEEPSVFLEKPATDGCRFPKRYIVVLLICLGLFLVSWMRNNIDVAIIHIITTDRRTESGIVPDSKQWTMEEMEIVDSVFFWSLTAAQIPGTLLVLILSPHGVLAASIALSSLLHMIIPMALKYHLRWVIAVNILQGIAESPLYAAAIGMCVQWTPQAEKTRLTTIALCGLYMSRLLGLPISLFIVENIGEEIVFYASGIAGLVWCFLWSTMTFQSPSNDPFISQSELQYLEESIDSELKTPIKLKTIPLKALFTSLPVLAICVAEVCLLCCGTVSGYASVLYYGAFSGRAGYQILYELSLPHLLMFALVIGNGFLADTLINRTCLSTVTVRKLFCSGAFVLHGVIITAVTISEPEVAVFCLIAAFEILGFAVPGFVVNSLDLCPRYASLVAGISGTVGSLGVIIFTIIIEHITPHPGTLFHDFKAVFIAASVLSFFGAITFAVFASGEPQSWDKTTTDSPDNNYEKENTDAGCYPKPDSEDVEFLVSENL